MPAAKLALTPKCGRCHEELGPITDPLAIESSADFDELVSGSPIPVLVDFWAAWCQPCHAVAPELEKLARTQAGRTVVVKVDTELLPDVAGRYGIRGIPTMILFERGNEASRVSGAMPAEEIARRVGLS